MTEQIPAPARDSTTDLRTQGSGNPNDPGDPEAGRLSEASPARLIAILLAIVLFTEVVPLQVGMFSIILPKIGHAFPASGNATGWAITILGIVGGATTALVGKAGDLYGKKRILLWCSAVFVVGTLICAVTSNWGVFLFGRGLSAASLGMIVVNYGLVRDLMPRRWVPIAVGVIGTGFGVSSIIGPLACGVLTDHFSWRSVCWFLIIYMLVMIPVFAWIVPESPVRVRQRFDVLGAVLFGAGVALALIYLSQGSSWGWISAKAVSYLVGGLVLLAVFVAWQLRARDPMLDLPLLRAPGIWTIMVVSFCIVGVQTLASVMVAYMFETPGPAELQGQILHGAAEKTSTPVSVLSQIIHFRGDTSYGAGYSVLQLAVHITIWVAVFTMIFGIIGGYLARQYGARLPLVLAAAGLVIAFGVWINWHSTWQSQVTISVLLGLGGGFFFAAGPNLIMDAVPAERQGISAGMVQVCNAIGSSVATALLISILAAHPFQTVTTTPGGGSVVTDVPQVYTDSGYSQAYLLLGVIPCVIALILALALRTGRTPARGGAPI
jgi:MFS family permease